MHAGFIGFRAFAARKIVQCKLIANSLVIQPDHLHSTVKTEF